MIVVNNEKYTLKLFHLKENSSYEWEETPAATFKGRLASPIEKKTYRIQQGVNGGTDSTYVISSNLPHDVKPKDKIIFLGKEWTVESVGFYFDQNQVVNPSLFNDEYIAKRSPKGIALQ